MKKRLLSIVLALVMAMGAGLAGCRNEPNNDITTPPDDTVIKYTVTFVTNGGSEVESMETDKILSEPVTERNSYDFLGWFEAQDLSGERIEFPYDVTKDTTFYAAWELRLPTVLELLNDPYYAVKTGNGSGIVAPPDITDYNDLIAANKPLQVDGEDNPYTEDFSGNYFNTRLRPYYRTYGAPDEPKGATFELEEITNNLIVTVSGVSEFDYIQFRGMRFVKEGNYSVSVTYESITANRNFILMFDTVELCNLSYSATETTATGTFTAWDYSNDVNRELRIAGDNIKAPAQIRIKSIEIERHPDRPSAENVRVDGIAEVDGELTVSYNYIGEDEGDTEIKWFIASGKNDENLTVLSEFDDDKSITITAEMTGYYVGAMVIPVANGGGAYSRGKAYKAYLASPIDGRLSYPITYLKNVGDSFTEDFEDISPTGNIRFEKWMTDGYITDDDSYNGSKITGGKLYVYTDTVTGGAYFRDISLKGNNSYKISFDYKIIEESAGVMCLLFKSYSLNADHLMELKRMNIGTELSSEYYVDLGDADDYQFMIYTNGGANSLIIDNLKIECVEKPVIEALDDIGDKLTQDFDSNNNLKRFYTNGTTNYEIISSTNNITGNSLKITTSRYFAFAFSDLSGVLSPNGTYKVSYKCVFTEQEKPNNFFTAFKGGDGVYIFNSESKGNTSWLNTYDGYAGYTANNVVEFADVYTLGNRSDYVLEFFNVGEIQCDIILDNITIEKIAPIPALDEIGDKVEQNFDDNNLVKTLRADPNIQYEIISDSNAILGNSLKITSTAYGRIQLLDFTGGLTPGGKYKISFDYNYITTGTGIWAGFQSFAGFAHNGRYSGEGHENSASWVNNTLTSGRFTDVITLGTEMPEWLGGPATDYRPAIFAEYGGVSVVIDNLIIEKVQYDLLDLLTIGGSITEDFDTVNLLTDFYSTADSHEIVESGINGKSLKISATGAFEFYFQSLAYKLAAEGKYKVSFDYQYITGHATGSVGVGFKNLISGTVATGGAESWVNNSTPGTTGRFSVIISLTDVADYRLWFWNYAAGDMEILIDNITIERVQYNLSDLLTIGGSITEDFDTVNLLTDFFPVDIQSVVSGGDGFEGNALKIASATGLIDFYFQSLDGKLAANGQYTVSFKYKYTDGKAGAGIWTSFKSIYGTGTTHVYDNPNSWVNNGSPGNVYNFTVTLTLDNNSDYRLHFWDLGGEFEILIDDITITRIA